MLENRPELYAVCPHGLCCRLFAPRLAVYPQEIRMKRTDLHKNAGLKINEALLTIVLHDS